MTNYRRKRTPPKDRTPQYNVNEDIQAETVRLLDENGTMIGVFPLQEALKMGQEREMDLIEINPKANPPVVKFMDYYKFSYQLRKSSAAKQHKSDVLKQIRVSVRISIHDIQVQARKIDAFLNKGFKVQLRVQMKGRERQFPDIAQQTMRTLMGEVTTEYEIETEPKLTGDSIVATIKSKKR